MVIFAMAMNDLEKLEVCAPDIALQLKLLANERRVSILCRLAAAKDELSIAALTGDLQIGPSALSQHLKKLRRSGLVVSRRAGHNCFYRLADSRAALLAIGLQKHFTRTTPSRAYKQARSMVK